MLFPPYAKIKKISLIFCFCGFLGLMFLFFTNATSDYNTNNFEQIAPKLPGLDEAQILINDYRANGELTEEGVRSYLEAIMPEGAPPEIISNIKLDLNSKNLQTNAGGEYFPIGSQTPSGEVIANRTIAISSVDGNPINMYRLAATLGHELLHYSEDYFGTMGDIILYGNLQDEVPNQTSETSYSHGYFGRDLYGSKGFSPSELNAYSYSVAAFKKLSDEFSKEPDPLFSFGLHYQELFNFFTGRTMQYSSGLMEMRGDVTVLSDSLIANGKVSNFSGITPTWDAGRTTSKFTINDIEYTMLFKDNQLQGIYAAKPNTNLDSGAMKIYVKAKLDLSDPNTTDLEYISIAVNVASKAGADLKGQIIASDFGFGDFYIDKDFLGLNNNDKYYDSETLVSLLGPLGQRTYDLIKPGGTGEISYSEVAFGIAALNWMSNLYKNASPAGKTVLEQNPLYPGFKSYSASIDKMFSANTAIENATEAMAEGNLGILKSNSADVSASINQVTDLTSDISTYLSSAISSFDPTSIATDSDWHSAYEDTMNNFSTLSETNTSIWDSALQLKWESQLLDSMPNQYMADIGASIGAPTGGLTKPLDASQSKLFRDIAVSAKLPMAYGMDVNKQKYVYVTLPYTMGGFTVAVPITD